MSPTATTIDALAECIAEGVHSERNIFRSLPPDERDTYRKIVRCQLETLVMLNRPNHAGKALDPDPADPVPIPSPTIKSVVAATCYVMGVSQTQLARVQSVEMDMARRAAAFLCRAVVVPRPALLDVRDAVCPSWTSDEADVRPWVFRRSKAAVEIAGRVTDALGVARVDGWREAGGQQA